MSAFGAIQIAGESAGIDSLRIPLWTSVLGDSATEAAFFASLSAVSLSARPFSSS